MLKKAVLYLDRIRQGRAEEEDTDLEASEESDTHPLKSKDRNGE